MKYLLTFIVVFAIYSILSFIFIHIDLMLNPWIRNVVTEIKWYNCFTSRHAITALYLKSWGWLIPVSIISALISLPINYVISKK